MIVVTVKPSRGDDGSQAYSTRGQLFDGYVDRRLVVSRSSQPLLDACRVLAGEGIDPSTRAVMCHEGQDYDALRSTVGAAAKLTVSDRKGPPAFGAWQPFGPRPYRNLKEIPVRPTARPARLRHRAVHASE